VRRELQLPDDRRLSWLEFGDPAGAPALYLHGTPSSASEARPLAALASDNGVRLVAIDRPGYLGSSEPRDASLLGASRDLVAAADALGLESFAVVGFSGGAGYALAVAHLAGARVTVVHLGGGIGSLHETWDDLPRARRILFRAVAGIPPVVSRPVLGLLFRLNLHGLEKRLEDPAAAMRWFYAGPARGAQVAAVDAYVDSVEPSLLRSDLLDFRSATRAVRAAVSDVAVYAKAWPFNLAQIETPVEFWHGSDDPAAPQAFARRAAVELPNARLHLFEGEGHFVFHTHAAEIVESIRTHAGVPCAT
jgi:pimeloyl-ACP methyl ester carboxylesterase